MLDFADLPYEFVPPKPNGAIIALAQFLNRRIGLPGKSHRLTGVEVRGAESFATAQKEKGARIVLLPNHPTHSDPQVMTEICRQLGVRPSFMAAYEVFARSKAMAWVMQRFGAFSVDREGSDRKSMKCASGIIAAGKYPLVLFPEGNVYLCNDRVTPFAEGAAYIALRAQKSLGDEVPVYLVPVSLKYTHLEDVRAASRADLNEIAGHFGTQLDEQAPVTDELKRISIIALARFLQQLGHIPPDSELDPDEKIHHAAEQILSALEKKMELSPRASDERITRVRKIRAAVHGIRTDPNRAIDHRAASHWADEAMLALRILGYYGGYSSSDPTLDRVAETIARLREDVSSQAAPPTGSRRCIAQLGTPLDLREHLPAFQENARGTIGTLTGACESAVQDGIDAINRSNEELGGRPF